METTRALTKLKVYARILVSFIISTNIVIDHFISPESFLLASSVRLNLEMG